jgi:hypothetical protein
MPGYTAGLNLRGRWMRPGLSLHDPCHHLAVAYSLSSGPPFIPIAYAQPVPLPPGYGALVVSVNRGHLLIPSPSTTTLKVDGREVPIPFAGTWHIPLPAGPHDVKYTDVLGIPLMTTRPQVIQPGMPHYLSFDFGMWRHRVRDGAGNDVTKFGLWSNYTVLLILLAIIAACCCVPVIGGGLRGS